MLLFVNVGKKEGICLYETFAVNREQDDPVFISDRNTHLIKVCPLQFLDELSTYNLNL